MTLALTAVAHDKHEEAFHEVTQRLQSNVRLRQHQRQLFQCGEQDSREISVKSERYYIEKETAQNCYYKVVRLAESILLPQQDILKYLNDENTS
jgi:hypothetical protein